MLIKTNKVGRKPKTFSTQHVYADYAKQLIANDLTLKGEYAHGMANGKVLKENGTVYIDYPTYKKILAAFSVKAGLKLLHGYCIDMLNGLGYLFILRIGRSPINPKLNKGESYKLRKELQEAGTLTKTNWRVFHTDEEYIRLKWFKPSYLRGLNFYTFSPAGGQPGKGFRQLMSRTIASTPSLKALYPFVPYKGS